MLPLNKSFWSLDQKGLFKVSIWNDFLRNEFGRNLEKFNQLKFMTTVIETKYCQIGTVEKGIF